MFLLLCWGYNHLRLKRKAESRSTTEEQDGFKKPDCFRVRGWMSHNKAKTNRQRARGFTHSNVCRVWFVRRAFAIAMAPLVPAETPWRLKRQHATHLRCRSKIGCHKMTHVAECHLVSRDISTADISKTRQLTSKQSRWIKCYRWEDWYAFLIWRQLVLYRLK